MRNFASLFFFLLSLCLANPIVSSQTVLGGNDSTVSVSDSVVPSRLMNDTLIVPFVYKVNRYRIVPPYTTVDSVRNLLSEMISSRRLKLSRVQIFGTASPEGPWEHNVFLGNSRALALYNYLMKRVPLNSEIVSVRGGAEDWAGTVDSLMAHPEFPYRDKILSIIRSTSNVNARKLAIKKIENGRIWHKLITEIFPPLRNARIKIDYYSYLVPVQAELLTLWPETSLPEIGPLAIYKAQVYSVPTRFFALKTNVLFLAALCANVGFETELWQKWSLDIPFWYSPYDIRRPDRKIRLFGVQPELRYWLGPKAGDGLYLGVHGHLFGFNIALDNETRYQDPNRALWGAGIGAGYAWSFGKKKHFYLDLGIGAGYANIVYDKYRNWSSGPIGSPRYASDMTKNYWGLTRLNFSIGYKWYRARKR